MGCKWQHAHCKLKNYTPYGVGNALSLETRSVAVSVADAVVGI